MYRKSNRNDCKEIYNLICDMEEKELPYDTFLNIYSEQIESNQYYCLVCEYGDKIAGVLNLRFEWQLHHGEKIAEILEFAVDKAYRRKGIGKEMLEKACEIAREQRCTQIEVACNQLRKDTHRFYQREGLHNFHFRFSKPLNSEEDIVNGIGR